MCTITLEFKNNVWELCNLIHVKCEYTTSSYACFIPPLQIKIFFTSLKKIPILEHAMLNVSLCKYLSIALDILASQNGLLSLHQ